MKRQKLLLGRFNEDKPKSRNIHHRWRRDHKSIWRLTFQRRIVKQWVKLQQGSKGTALHFEAISYFSSHLSVAKLCCLGARNQRPKTKLSMPAPDPPWPMNELTELTGQSSQKTLRYLGYSSCKLTPHNCIRPVAMFVVKWNEILFLRKTKMTDCNLWEDRDVRFDITLQWVQLKIFLFFFCFYVCHIVACCR